MGIYSKKTDIQDEIDYLLDDNKICMDIIDDDSSSKADIKEARQRLKANKEQMKRLNNKLKELVS